MRRPRKRFGGCMVRLLATVAPMLLAAAAHGHAAYHPNCYILFDGGGDASNQDGAYQWKEIDNFGRGINLTASFEGLRGGSATEAAVAWDLSSFRLVTSSIVGGKRAFSGDEPRTALRIGRDSFYYFGNFPNPISQDHFGISNPEEKDADAFAPLYPGLHDQNKHLPCLELNNSSRGINGVDGTTFFGRDDIGFSNPIYAGAIPSGTSAYVTYFYALKRVPFNNDTVEHMLEGGVRYVNESNEGNVIGVDAPRSRHADATSLRWRCVVPEDDGETRRIMRPFTETVASRAVVGGTAVGRCPGPPSGGGPMQLDLDNLDAGALYEVFVGAMLLPHELPTDPSEAREGDRLTNAAHMFFPEVYTMPFDDHTGEFGPFSAANVALPDATFPDGQKRQNALTDYPTENVWLRQYEDICLRIDDREVVVRKDEWEGRPCSDIGWTTWLNPPVEIGDQDDALNCARANVGCARNLRLFFGNNNTGMRVGIDGPSTHPRGGRFYGTLPYGQTIQGLLMFVPDVPERPVIQIGSVQLGAANEDDELVFFGGRLEGLDEPEGDFPSVVVVDRSSGRPEIVLRMSPTLEYGSATTYTWRQRSAGGEWGEESALEVGLHEPVGTQGVVRSRKEWVEWRVEVEIGQSYSFEVLAESQVGSNAGFAGVRNVLAAELPEVGKLEGTATGPQRASVSWELDTDGGSRLERFEYRYQEYKGQAACEDGAPAVVACRAGSDPAICKGWTDNGGILGVNVDGLKSGSTYQFGVRAESGAGKGRSQWQCVTVGAPPSPPAVRTQARPVCPDVEGNAGGCIGFSWSPAVANGGDVVEYHYFLLPLTEFEEQFPDFADDREAVPDDNDARWQVACSSSSIVEGTCAFSTVVDGLDFGAQYQLLVRARNEFGWGGVAFGVLTTLPGAPAAPESLAVTARDGALALTWIAGAERGTAIVGYRVRYRRFGGAAWGDYRTVRPQCAESAAAECAHEVTGLTNGEEYEIELLAVNAAGFGEPVIVRGTPAAADIAAVVTGLKALLEETMPADCTSTCSLAFTWNVPRAGCPDRYEYGWIRGDWKSVRCSVDGNGICRRADNLNASCEGARTGQVGAGGSLVFRVRPVIGGMVGRETSVTTIVGLMPAAPSAEAEAGDGSVTLAWEVVQGPVERYEYRFRAGGVGVLPGTWSNWISVGGVRQVRVGGLTNGREYDFAVRAVNAVGVGAETTVSATPEGSASGPGAPGTLQVTVADAEITLQWPAARAGTGQNVETYGCRYRPTGTIPWTSCLGGDGVVTDDNTADATAAVTVSGLVNGLTYEFEVWATTGTGDTAAESDRVRAEAMPLAPVVAPGAPQQLVALAHDGSVTLRWSPAESVDGTPVSGYEYRWRRVGGAFGSWTDACAFAAEERVRCRAVVEWTVPSLANGTRLQFELRARKADHLHGPSATVWVTPQSVPGGPLDPRHAASGGDFHVSWRPPNDDGGTPILRYEYRVRIGEGEFGAWRVVDDRLIESGARYTLLLPDVRDDVDYVVELRAVNEVGNGAAVAVSRLAGSAADEALSATPGDRGVELRWRVASASDVVRYEYRCIPEAVDCTGWVDASARLRREGDRVVVAVTGLTNGTEYTFEVRRVDAQGAPGAPDRTRATPVGVPGVPTLEALPGDGEATLTWRPPLRDGGAPVLRYEYRWSVAGGGFGSWQAHRAGSPRVVVGGLTNGREHVFALRAVNPAGPGSEARVTVTPGAAPDAPRQLTAVRGDGAVTLRWTAPAVDGGVAVSDYQYRYRRADVQRFGGWQSVGAATVVTVAGLDNGVDYVFEVRAVSAVAVGAVVTTSAMPGAAPGAPQGIAAEPGDGQVALTWSAPAVDGGLNIVRYEVRHSTRDQPPGGWADVGLELGTTVEGLTNDVAYVFEVRAVNAEGAGAVVSVLASPWVASAPDAPALTARPDSRRVALSWNVPDNGGDDIVRFEYRWRVEGETFGDWVDVALDTGVAVEELQNGVAHEFEVRAVNGIAAGTAGAASATPAGRPSAPELTVRAGSEEVALTWRAPDDDGGLAIERYEYRWRARAGAFVAWRDGGNERRATARGLSNGTTYEFEVRAVNDVGPGDASSATATPLPGVDDDRLAEAWLGRFGRVSAGHVVDALQARFTDALAAPALWRSPEGRPGDREDRETVPADRPTPQSERVRHRGGVGGRVPGQAWNLVSGLAAQAAMSGGRLDLRSLARQHLPWLDATSFQLSATPGAGSTSVAAWGQLASGGFDGGDSIVELDGAVRTITLGGDIERGDLLAGMAVSHSTADGGFDFLAMDNVPARSGDDVESTLTGLYPYAHLRAGRISLWGAGGAAEGEMSLTGDGVNVEADMTGGMAAAGLRGVWLGSDRLEIAVKSDLLRTWLTAEGDRLRTVEADANRIRLLLEASLTSGLQGGRLTSSVELGLRHDSGTVDNAGGLEVGGSLRFAGGRRLTLAAQGRAVVTHGAEGFGEWGLSGSILYAPRESGTGASLRFEPAYGISASHAERMWAEPEQRRFGFRERPSFGIDARFGYGLRSPRSGAIWQPYIATGYRRGTWIHRFGWRVEGGWLDVVDGEAFHRPVQSGGPSQQGGFGVSIRASRRL